jgi:hypothetical protein
VSLEPHVSIVELREAMEIGRDRERARITKLLEEKANLLDKIRPESYKRAADFADLRIRTYRHMIKIINDEPLGEEPID